MRKLTIHLFGSETIDEIIENRTKSVIRNENSKWFFYSKFTGRETINVTYVKREIDINFSSEVKKMIDGAKEQATKISEEEIGSEIYPGSIEVGLESVLYAYSEKEDFDYTVFDLSTDLFIRILMSHYLRNGNKRTAIAFLKLFLWHMGYYLKYTGGDCEDWSKHRTIVEEFVIDLENNERSKNSYEKELARIKILEWIKQNVMIGLNWRGND